MSKYNQITTIKHGHLVWLIKQAESLIKQKRYYLECEEKEAIEAIEEIKNIAQIKQGRNE